MSDRHPFRVWIGPTLDRTSDEITDLVTGITIEAGRRGKNDPVKPATATIQLNNSDTRFTSDVARIKAAYRVGANCRITVEAPAPGRWNRLKARLRRHRGFRWLRVRTVQIPRYIGPIVPWSTS